MDFGTWHVSVYGSCFRHSQQSTSQMRSGYKETSGCTSQAPRGELPERDSVPYGSPQAGSPISDHSLLTWSPFLLPTGVGHCAHLLTSFMSQKVTFPCASNIYLLKSSFCFLAPLFKCSHNNSFLLGNSQYCHTPTWVTACTLINTGATLIQSRCVQLEGDANALDA